MHTRSKGNRQHCPGKEQSVLLAEMIDEILDQLITLEGNPFSFPTGTPPGTRGQ